MERPALEEKLFLMFHFRARRMNDVIVFYKVDRLTRSLTSSPSWSSSSTASGCPSSRSPRHSTPRPVWGGSVNVLSFAQFEREFSPANTSGTRSPHAPIVDHEIWHRVQRQLAEHTLEDGAGSRHNSAALLAGKLFDDRGNR